MAIVIYANFYQFGPRERVENARVQSRMLLWGRVGTGVVTVNGHAHRLAAGDFLFLPWQHHIVYEADARRPFFVGGIHLIPEHRKVTRIEYLASHSTRDPWADHPARRDVRWPGLEGIVSGKIGDRPLGPLASYIVAAFHDHPPEEPVMRDLGRLLVRELSLTVAAGAATHPALPAALRRIQEHAANHLREKMPVDALARLAGCGPATVHRLFRRFLDTTPHAFLAGLRLREARRLLRSTDLPIREVGARVGFEDAFHFSRFFRRGAGLSPRAYRQGVPAL